MNILNLLKKYESNDSIEYLVKTLGSEEYLIDLFTSTMGLNYFIENNILSNYFFIINRHLNILNILRE